MKKRETVMVTQTGPPLRGTRPIRVHSRTAEIVCVALFISVMAAANLAIAAFGPWFLPVTAFVSVGVSMVCRDYLHDVWSEYRGGFWVRMFGMVVAAAVLAFLLDASAGMVAFASVCAIVGSTLIETAAFTALIRQRWLIRSNGSSILGSFGDSIIFPLVAFGVGGVDGFLLLVLTQTATKSLGGVFWSVVFRYTLNPDKRRAERRQVRARLAQQEGDHVHDQ